MFSQADIWLIYLQVHKSMALQSSLTCPGCHQYYSLVSGKLVQDIDCYRYREAQAASRRKNPGHCKRAVGARSCGNYITSSPHRAPLGAKHVTVSHLKALNMCGGSVIPQLRAPTARLQWPGFCRHYVAHISCLWFRNILPDTNKYY